MLLVHGFGNEAHIWDEFAEAMSPYYHVYAVDQRGHGESQWATDGYERERFVADLSAFLDQLSLHKVTLVGLSMGGWNALLYTPGHQDRVERVIIVDIAPEPSEVSLRQWGTRPPTPMEFDSLEEAVAWGREGNPGATDARHQKDMADKLRWREDGKWVWRADPSLFNSLLRGGRDDEMIGRYWRGLKAITCPILEVRGTLSILVSDDTLQRMKEVAKEFDWIDVAGAGHVVTVDKPQEFIAVTREFLGALP